MTFKSKTKEYDIWKQMRRRCTKPTDASWEWYGARGVKVCKRWEKFENFIEDVGPRPTSRHTLDRIDFDGDYEPGNVRWATWAQQARNKRNTKNRGDRDYLELSVGITAKKAAYDKFFSAERKTKGATECKEQESPTPLRGLDVGQMVRSWAECASKGWPNC